MKRIKRIIKIYRDDQKKHKELISEINSEILKMENGKEVAKEAKKKIGIAKGLLTRAKKGTIKLSVKEAENRLKNAKNSYDSACKAVSEQDEKIVNLKKALEEHDKKYNNTSTETEAKEETVEENKFINFIKRNNRLIIAIAIMAVLITIIIVIMNCCTRSSEKVLNPPSTCVQTTTSQTTTVQPTTVQPTTVQPTTVQPTTVQPTTAKPTTAKEDVDNDYYESDNQSGLGSGSTEYSNSNSKKVSNYNVGNGIGNYDMSSEKDSQKDEGKTGGNKGYGASISNKVESPSPEKINEEKYPLSTTVSKEDRNDFPTAPVKSVKDTVDNTAE